MASPGPAAAASPCGSAPLSPRRAVSPCADGQSLAYRGGHQKAAADLWSPPAWLALGHLRPLSSHLGSMISPPPPPVLSMVATAPSLSHHLGLRDSGSGDRAVTLTVTGSQNRPPGASSSSDLALLPRSQSLQKEVSRSPSEVMLKALDLSR